MHSGEIDPGPHQHPTPLVEAIDDSLGLGTLGFIPDVRLFQLGIDLF